MNEIKNRVLDILLMIFLILVQLPLNVPTALKAISIGAAVINMLINIIVLINKLKECRK